MTHKTTIFSFCILYFFSILPGPTWSSNQSVIIASRSQLDDYILISPRAQVYSTDEEILDFVFAQCVKKFTKTIMREDVIKVGAKNNFHGCISVMDMVHITKESQGSQIDRVQKLCNGDYTSGWGPLHFAIIYHKNIDTAKILIEYGADVNHLDMHKKTPLKYALERFSKKSDPRMFQFLLQHGADINAKNHDNKTLLDEVVKQYSKCNEYLIPFLLKHGADIDAALPETKDKLVRLGCYQKLKNDKP